MAARLRKHRFRCIAKGLFTRRTDALRELGGGVGLLGELDGDNGMEGVVVRFVGW